MCLPLLLIVRLSCVCLIVVVGHHYVCRILLAYASSFGGVQILVCVCLSVSFCVFRCVCVSHHFVVYLSMCEWVCARVCLCVCASVYECMSLLNCVSVLVWVCLCLIVCFSHRPYTEEGFALKQNVLGRKNDVTAANQQMLLDDTPADDPDIAFLASLSKAEKKKLFKKLSKLEQAESGDADGGYFS